MIGDFIRLQLQLSVCFLQNFLHPVLAYCIQQWIDKSIGNLGLCIASSVSVVVMGTLKTEQQPVGCG